MELDDGLLDDAAALVEADTRDLLVMTASAGASMRAAAANVDQESLNRIIEDGRPHAVVVVGGGGSRAAGDILAAVAGTGSPVPVLTFGGPSLPGWVGPTDLVIAVSGSGGTRETVLVASEAARRGCRLVAICPRGTQLSQVVEQTRGAVQFAVGLPPVAGKWRARTMLWSLATPLILIAGALRIVEGAQEAITTTAKYLDGVAEVSSPLRDPIVNDAKRLAVDVGLSLPILWGTGDVGSVAVRRFARQLAENAGLPSIVGTLPEAARTQAVLLAGPRAGAANVDDIFRDRVDEPEPAARLRLILLRDHDEHPETAALAAAAAEVAAERGVPVNVISAQAGHSLTRLAMLIGVTDFASVYAGLALGIDPMSAANELDGRVR